MFTALIRPARAWNREDRANLTLHAFSTTPHELIFNVALLFYDEDSREEPHLVGLYEGATRGLQGSLVLPLTPLDPGTIGRPPESDLPQVNVIEVTWNSPGAGGAGDITFEHLSFASPPATSPPPETLSPAKVKIEVVGRLSKMRAKVRRPSPPQSLTVQATSLAGTVEVKASKGFEVSLRQSGGYSQSVVIRGKNGIIKPPRQVWVRVAPATRAARSVTGRLTISSKGAKTISQTLLGSISRR